MDEIIQRERTEYENLSPLAQKEKERALRELVKVNNTGSKTLEKLQTAYNEKLQALENSNKDTVDTVELAKKVSEFEKSKILETGKKLLGQKMYGVEFSEAELNDIVEKYDVNEGSKFLDKDEMLDPVKFIVHKFEQRNKETMFENEVQARLKKILKGQYIDPKLQSPGGIPRTNQEHPDVQILIDMGMPSHVIESARKRLKN